MTHDPIDIEAWELDSWEEEAVLYREEIPSSSTKNARIKRLCAEVRALRNGSRATKYMAEAESLELKLRQKGEEISRLQDIIKINPHAQEVYKDCTDEIKRLNELIAKKDSALGYVVDHCCMVGKQDYPKWLNEFIEVCERAKALSSSDNGDHGGGSFTVYCKEWEGASSSGDFVKYVDGLLIGPRVIDED